MCSAASKPSNSIDFLCYQTVPEWWDGHLPAGTAGSEEAVVEMSRCFAKRGWHTVVYNNCGDREREINGVHYIPRARYQACVGVDVTIVWRSLRLLDDCITSSRVYLWSHDDVSQKQLTPNRLSKIQKIIAISRFQRGLWPDVPDSKILLSSNGLDPEKIKRARSLEVVGSIRKNRTKCIYASAPERGLECLLKLWPRIYSQVSDATLSIFYGWELWNIFYSRDPGRIEWKESLRALMDQPGIMVKCENVDAERLWLEYLTSGIWVYPTEWKENSCITAMKAQACGALPVTTAVAALAETVKWGCRVDATDIYTNAAAQTEFVAGAIKYMSAPDEVYRERMMDWGKHTFCWESIADQWEHEFVVPEDIVR